MVKIKIDTKEDSPEDIRKVIEFLKGYLGEKAAEAPRQSEPAPASIEMFPYDAADEGVAEPKGDKPKQKAEFKPMYY